MSRSTLAAEHENLRLLQTLQDWKETIVKEIRIMFLFSSWPGKIEA